MIPLNAHWTLLTCLDSLRHIAKRLMDVPHLEYERMNTIEVKCRMWF